MLHPDLVLAAVVIGLYSCLVALLSNKIVDDVKEGKFAQCHLSELGWVQLQLLTTGLPRRVHRLGRHPCRWVATIPVMRMNTVANLWMSLWDTVLTRLSLEHRHSSARATPQAVCSWHCRSGELQRRLRGT